MSEQLTSDNSHQEESKLPQKQQLKAAPGRLIAKNPQSAKTQPPQIIRQGDKLPQNIEQKQQNVSNQEQRPKKSKSQSAAHRRGGQKKTKKIVISTFDKLEEARYKSYETQQILSQMVDLINFQSSMHKSPSDSFVTLGQDSWNEIKTLANQASNLFQDSNNDWDAIVDILTSEVNEYKHICHRMKTKLESIKRERFDQRRNHEDTLMDIASAYNKGRTQLFTVMDELELAMHDLKHGIEKRNVKQMSYMTQIEKDIDDAFSDIILNSNSDRLLNLQGQNSRNETNNNSSRHGQRVHQTYQLQNDNENAIVITPRNGQQPLSGRRGRSQQPAQKESVLPPQHPNLENRKVNIPLLPIHIINHQRDSQQNSNRGGIPTAPGSHRSHQQLVAVPSQSQLSNRLSSRRQSQLPPTHGNHQQYSARGGNVSQRSKNGMRHDLSGRNSYHDTPGGQGQDSKRSIQGGIIDGEYLVNPVFLGAVYQTSRFDKALEDDYEDADQTLPFETDRLKQYADEYQMLIHVEDEEQKILLKQWLFMLHEKELKAQAKQEKALRIQQRRAARAAQDQQQQHRNSFEGTTPRGARGSVRHDENDQTLKEPSVEMPMGRNEGSEHRNGLVDESFTGSHISLHRGALPLLGTLEMISARRKEMLNDVQLDQLLDVPQEIHDLIKTATEKSIILKIEKEYQEKEELKREDRKVLEWSSQDDNGTDSSFATDSTPAEGKQSVESSKKSVANAQVIVKLDNQQQKGCRLYSNGAINIMDMVVNPDNVDQQNKPLVGEFTPEKSFNKNFNLNTSPQLSEILEDSHFELDNNLKVELVNQKWNRHVPQAPRRVVQKQVDNFVFPQYEHEDLYQIESGINYQNNQLQNIDQLEIIHERQSELSSSINTQNKQHQFSKMNSHRNSKQQLNSNLVMLIPPQPSQISRQGDHRVLSARENSQHSFSKNGVDFNRLQYLQPPSQVLQLQVPNKSFEVGAKNSEVREEKYKRCKSHRKSLQSAPNSQRGTKPSSNKMLLGNYNNNYDSIQADESLEEDQIAQVIQNRNLNVGGFKDQHRRPVTELRQHDCEDESEQSNSFGDSTIRYKMESEVHHKNNMFARRLSPIVNDSFLQQCPQHFSSIQNQFDESKTSGYKNESLFMNDSSMKFMQSPRAISDRGIEFRDGEELCDFDDLDINQLHQLCNKFVPLSSILRDNNESQTKADNSKIDQSPLYHNKILPGTNSQSLRHQFLLHNINSSMLLQGNQSNPSAGLLFPSGTQKHNQSNLMLSRGLTANMITNYLLQNFTQLKLLPGQLTREVVETSKKPRQINEQQKATQIHGQSGFTLSTLGDETLMYMFPPQKTQRRTLFMLQNFHNNYYNNQAGVLFTMPISTGEINNGFLQQCSTVPSADPDHMISGGGMTQIQSKKVSNQARHHHNHQFMNPNQSQRTNMNHQVTGVTQDSFKEDSQQRYTLPQYYSDHQKQFTAALSKNNNVAAMSTGETGTLKSTALACHQLLRFNPQSITQLTNLGGQSQQLIKNQTSGGEDLSLSPRQSFEVNDKSGTHNSNLRHFSSQPMRGHVSHKQMQLITQGQMQPDQQQTIHQEQSAKSVSQGRLIKINPTRINSSVGGLAKLQALAGNAHSSAVSAGGGNLVIKKMPNVVKIQKASITPSTLK